MSFWRGRDRARANSLLTWFDDRDAGWGGLEVPSIERQQGIDRCFVGTFSNDEVVSSPAGDFLSCSLRE
jgi:hypothetical protein